MTAPLRRYLALAYRRDILHESVNVESAMSDDPEFIKAAKAELARINAIGLGANLVSRDFVAYQNRRALEALIKRYEQDKANGS